MALRIRTPLLLFFSMLLFAGCVDSWRHTTPRDQSPTPEQARWWAANARRAEFVPEHGYRVPGTPGFFDASGRPLTASAASAVPDGRMRDSVGIPIKLNLFGSLFQSADSHPPRPAVPVMPYPSAAPPGEPAMDLTPEQAQWWRTNRHLARWIPGIGYQIVGINGSFDAAGHLYRSMGMARVYPPPGMPPAMRY